MSDKLLSLKAEILHNPHLKRIPTAGTRTSLEDVADFGIVDLAILTQAAGIILGLTAEIDSNSVSEQTQRLSEIVLPVAAHVGSISDSASNRLMSEIGGPLHYECFRLLTRMFFGGPYSTAMLVQLVILTLFKLKPLT